MIISGKSVAWSSGGDEEDKDDIIISRKSAAWSIIGEEEDKDDIFISRKSAAWSSIGDEDDEDDIEFKTYGNSLNKDKVEKTQESRL